MYADGGEVRLIGVRIEATRVAPGNPLGAGVHGQGKARLHLIGSHLVDNQVAGIWVRGAAAELRATGTRIDGTKVGLSDELPGDGLLVAEGAKAWLDAVHLDNNSVQGVRVVNAGSRLEARGLVVANSHAPATSTYSGTGIVVLAKASARLQRTRLWANHSAGLAAHDGGVVHASDLIADGTLAHAHAAVLGVGVDGRFGGRIDLVGARLHGNHYAGIACGYDCEINAAGLLVEKTLYNPGSMWAASGVAVGFGGLVRLSGARLSGNEGMGLLVAGEDGHVVADGLLVDTTQASKVFAPEDVVSALGMGMVASVGGSLEVRSCLVARNHAVGVAGYEGSHLSLEGCVMRRTLPQTTLVSDTHKAWAKLADGLLAAGVASLNVSDSVLAHNSRAGLLVKDGTKLSIERTAVLQNGFGLVELGSGKVDWNTSLLFDNPLGNVASDTGLAVPPPPAAVLSDEKSTGG